MKEEMAPQRGGYTRGREPPLRTLAFTYGTSKRAVPPIIAWVGRWGSPVKKTSVKADEARLLLDEFLTRAPELRRLRLLQDLAEVD